jgi:zinc protease
MKAKFSYIILFSFVFFLLSFLTITAQDINLEDQIPVSPDIKIGKLENGLTYYIRVNKKPENRAELRLAVNAGSILEDDDQQGLAHFVEHMAFNGTKNFKKSELVDYLESIGMRFGPDLNAYTSFDETVYMLQIPTDSISIMNKAFQILEDWAHQVSFEDEEIDKERGVIVEEWRLRRGAGARLFDKILPVILHDSRYAERLPIGKVDVLENFEYKTLRRFYQKWYRPELMAVVVVGDVDPVEIESKIKTHFGRIPLGKERAERKKYLVPDHDETMVAIATDPEATGSAVRVYYKMDVQEESKVGDYRRMLVENLYNSMLNRRFQELLQQPEPPFLYAMSSKSGLVRTKDAYTLGASVKDNGIEEGLEALLIESKRVKKYGFTQTELERAKTSTMRRMEQANMERDKTESRGYAAEYIRNFLTGEPIPGIELEFEYYKLFLPGISLEEVNRLGAMWMSEKSRVITVTAPEKEELNIPTEEELFAVYKKVAAMEIMPYEDKLNDTPLFAKELTPVPVTEKKYIEEIDVTEWKLSNGIKVILKPTDFQNDEILFSAYSPGGLSLVEDQDYVAASSATSIIKQSGVANFNMIELGKLLTGKIARVTPWIGELEEGFSGAASKRDLETMFQLIYLFFYEPRVDSTAFASYTYRLQEYIKNRDADPESAYSDTIQTTMSQNNFRRRPWSEELISEMDMNKSLAIYHDRFADASDFTFIFVGNFSPDSLQHFIETYMANLPDLERKETWRDRGVETPDGLIKKVVKKGIEEKGEVQIHYSGDFEWSALNDYYLRAMTQVLQIKLREVLREDLGGTYNVRASAFSSKYPRQTYRIIISFGCDPTRVDELVNSVNEQIDSLKTEVVDELYLTKVKESQLRAREKNEKENNFWLNKLESYYFHGWDPRDIMKYEEMYVNTLTRKIIQSTAKKYFDRKNVAQFVLLPEEKAQKDEGTEAQSPQL